MLRINNYQEVREIIDTTGGEMYFKYGKHLAQIRNWLHFDEEEMKPFNFEIVNPIENFTLNLNYVEEITPSPYSARLMLRFKC